MSLLDDLRRLARLPRSTSPFLSLYLDTRWDDEKQRERVRIFVKTRLRECLSAHRDLQGHAGDRLREDVDKVTHYVKGMVNREWDEEYAGVALFACNELDVYQVVRSHLPFAGRFGCSDQPLLRPAAEHAHTGGGGLLAVVSADAGKVLAFELGGVRRHFAFRDEEFPGRHEQGGWSQARYRRHVDDHVHRNLKRLASHLVRWADERETQRILLSGQDTLLAMFEEHLPKRAVARVCARLHTAPTVSTDVALDGAMEAVATARREADLVAVDGLLDQRAGKGRAAVGPVAVAEAVAAGKVHRLYLERVFGETGWKCFGCGALGVKVPLGCPRCGVSVDGVDLGEEYVRGTLATDGKVVLSEDHGGLLREGGVAAALRY